MLCRTVLSHKVASADIALSQETLGDCTSTEASSADIALSQAAIGDYTSTEASSVDIALSHELNSAARADLSQEKEASGADLSQAEDGVALSEASNSGTPSQGPLMAVHADAITCSSAVSSNTSFIKASFQGPATPVRSNPRTLMKTGTRKPKQRRLKVSEKELARMRLLMDAHFVLPNDSPASH